MNYSFKYKNIGTLLRLTLTIYFSLAGLLCFAQTSAPRVSIEVISSDNSARIRLSWESVEGAESYNIYKSTNPYCEDWTDLKATVGNGVNEYFFAEPIDELGRSNYFRITAVMASPIETVLVDGDLFGQIQVTIDPFHISKYEVTQAIFTDVMGDWEFYFPDSPTHPAEQVSWFDAIEFCNRLSIREELTPAYSYENRTDPDLWYEDFYGWNVLPENHDNITCNWEADGYRLPTEAEWAHAANGGVHPQLFTYAGSNIINEVAWYRDNSYGLGSDHPDYGTHPAGTKAPNRLHIYDMSGNIQEWCWDRSDGIWPPIVDNPRGPEEGNFRRLKGGSWMMRANFSEIIHRRQLNAAHSYREIGFRVCKRGTP